MEDALAAWLLEAGEAGYAALGARSVRLLHRGRDHPTLKSRRARCALLAEWSAEPPAAGRDLSTVPVPLLDAMRTDDVFTRVPPFYPWPDRTELRTRSR